MKLENTKNTTRNIKTGLAANFLLIGLQFIFRTVFIHRLGAEYLGLNSLFSSILSVLNLGELGLASSIIFAMYKPIAEDDNETICALMLFFKRSYQVIGSGVLGVGLIILPFLKYLIKSDVPPDVNLYVLYILVLANTVLSYYLFSYKNCLLSAHQRSDIKSKLMIYTSVFQYAIQIAWLFIIANYYVYLISNVVFGVFANYLVARAVDKNFPKLRARGKLDKDLKRGIIKKVKGMMIYKISGVVSTSLDSIIVSSFLGLVLLGKLNNYLYISIAILSVLHIFTSSMTAGIGNNLILHTKERNFKDYSILSFINNWMIGWCAICMLCLVQPFIKIWAGDTFLLPFDNVVFVVLLFYFTGIRNITNLYREAIGIWDSDKIRPILSATFNLCLNLGLVQVWGINGVLFSTIASYVIFDIGWGTVVLFKKGFDGGLRTFYFKQAAYTGITLAIAAATWFIITLIPGEGLLRIVGILAACIVIPNGLYVVMLMFFPDFKEALALLKSSIKVIRAKRS